MIRRIDFTKIIPHAEPLSLSKYSRKLCRLDRRLELMLINQFPMYHGAFRSDEPCFDVGEGLFPLLWRLSQALLDAEDGIWPHGLLKIRSGLKGLAFEGLPDHLLEVANPYILESIGVCSLCGQPGEWSAWRDDNVEIRCIDHLFWRGDVRHTLQIIQQLDEPLLNLEVIPVSGSLEVYLDLPTLMVDELYVWYLDLLTGLLHACHPGEGDFRYEDRGWPIKSSKVRMLGLEKHPHYWLACSRGIREATLHDPRLEKILRQFVDILEERVGSRTLAKQMMLTEHPIFDDEAPVTYGRRSEAHYQDLLDAIQQLPKGSHGW